MGRPDLAQRELETAKSWADDALLLQLAEAWVNLSAASIRTAICEAILMPFFLGRRALPVYCLYL